MTFKRLRQHLGALDPEIDPAVLDRGQGCLGNPGQRGKLALAQFLQFAQDTNRLADRDFDAFFCGTKFFHFMISCNRQL